MTKRLFIMLCVVMCIGMMAFTGCGSGEEASSESSEMAEVEYPIIVEDNDYFTFEITGYDSVWGEHKYKITNKLDQDVTFDGEKAVINDENTVDAFICCDLAGGTSGKESFYLDEDQLSDYKEGQEITMTIQYKIFDEETLDEVTSGSFDYVFVR